MITVIIFLTKKHSNDSDDSDEYFAKQNGVMPDVAYIINGNPDGSKNMKRWPNAYKLCNLLGDRLGFECKHLPAKFVTDDDYIKECGDHTDNNKKDKYTRGCTYAHKNAFEQIVKNNKSAIIFEDDINIDNYLETENNIRKILNNLPEDFDIIYLDYCWSNCKKQNDYDEYFKNSNHTLCRHFYLVSRDGASKILKETMPMYDNGDLMYLDLVDNNKLVSYDVKPEIFKVKQNREQLGSELNNNDTHPKCKTFNDEINSSIFGFFGSVFKGSS